MFNLSLIFQDLQRILTKSRDYDELVHVWKTWRDAAGKPIRDKYLRFVNLSNEAATLNGKYYYYIVSIISFNLKSIVSANL